jgi:predicted glycogen debranching enzyme
MRIHLPERICTNLHAALSREWLVTNGIGGFASGTVAGALTRRYHGLLLAALHPPVGRTLLVTKLDDTAFIAGRKYPLYTNIWRSGVEQSAGYHYLRQFEVRLGVPTWTYDVGGVRLIKRIWMEAGHNTTFVRYELDDQGQGITLGCRLIVNDRDYHHIAHGGDRVFGVSADGPEAEVRPPSDSGPVYVRCAGPTAARAEWQMDYTWCHDFHLPVEAARGFDHLESHLVVGQCSVPLEPGDHVTFRIATAADRQTSVDGALKRCHDRAIGRLQAWTTVSGQRPEAAPVPVTQLVLAAAQFIVARPAPDAPDGHTIVAGYPWFTDWGRDTMIALPGLTLCTGRADVARQILRTWSHYVRQGLIPNRFPDCGDQPEYHTADATLWYLWAVDQYVRATGDVTTLAELFPVLCDIVAWHRKGTLHGIHVGDDGLVHTGHSGINLTWMDAKIGDRVITPRTGKPVELSALWYDGLCNLARLADLVEQPGDEFVRLAARTRKSFERFWNPHAKCLFDVIDTPSGTDASIRPNQIFAVALTHSPLSRPQQEAVVHTCEHRLLTWYGLRSLAPDQAGYRKHYRGGPVARDEAYHMGTAWGWLLGPLVLAHYRLHHNAAHARQMLEPMAGQLWTAGVGTLSEIFDGDEPFHPDGCTAQAWSVAETLRAWHLTQLPHHKAGRRRKTLPEECEP